MPSLINACFLIIEKETEFATCSSSHDQWHLVQKILVVTRWFVVINLPQYDMRFVNFERHNTLYYSFLTYSLWQINHNCVILTM